jgi:hypothetical protein
VSRFRDVFPGPTALIGMIHLPPLPGYPGSPGIGRIVEHALDDLRVLQQCSFDAVLVENEYDRPHRVKSSPETTAAMTRITGAVVQAADPLRTGCEILLNDPRASLAVAGMTGAAFIRTDYFVDRMTRPEYGEFDIDPDGLLDYRRSIGADDVLILADIQVKYATMLAPRPLAESAALAMAKGADAVVVTGDRSGDAPTLAQLRDAAQGLPVLIGSGLTPANAGELLAACDGAIVGTSIMRKRSVDPDAAAGLAAAAGAS